MKKDTRHSTLDTVIRRFALLCLALCVVLFAAPGWADGTIGSASYTWNETTGALTVTGGSFTREQWQAVIGKEKTIDPETIKSITFKADGSGTKAKLTDSAYIMFYAPKVPGVNDSPNAYVNLTELDLSGLDTSSVTRMDFMFDGCASLTSLDLRGLDTSNVTTMTQMFSDCSSLTSLDLSGFDTSRVGAMIGMFGDCKSLTTLTFGNNFNTSTVTNMNSMFNGCSGLVSLDLRGLDTSNVTTMQNMFKGCSGLTTLILGDRFVTANVKMDEIFSGCTSLTTVYAPKGTFDSSVFTGTGFENKEPVPYVAVTGVSLKETESVEVGKTVTLAATITPENATFKTVTWSSDKEAVATVSSSGEVKGITVGMATITVTATNGTANDATDDKSATCTVTVKATPAVATPPAAKSLTYKGTAQALIDEGSTTGGTMVYRLEGETDYGETIPQETNAGKYAVWYKVSGDVNYSDTEPASLDVTIGRASVTVTADNKEKTSGEADPALTATVAGMVNGESDTLIKYTLSRTAGEAVGKYAITLSGAAEQGNYAVTFVDGTLTIKQKPEEQKAVEEAVKTIEQNPALNGTPAGNALKDALTTGTPEKQAAAADVVEILDKSYTEEELKELDLSEDDVKKIIENKEQEARDLKDEAPGEVKDPTVPAATDLLAKSDNAALKDAGADLSVQPKVVTPEVLSATSRDQAVANIDKAAKNNDVPEGVDLEAVKAAAQPEALKTSNDITIEPASKNLEAQAKVVEKVFNEVSGDLASANGGKGVVIATVFPRMTPKVDGFFPLSVNLRNLLPGRRVRFWPSVSHFRRHAAGKVAVAGAELAAAGQEGDYFFLDENGNPTDVVSGDPAQMTAVVFLTASHGPYEDAFITADATEADQKTLTELAEKANPNPNGGENNPDTPTSNKGSGGCDTLSGGLLALAALGLVARKRK